MPVLSHTLAGNNRIDGETETFVVAHSLRGEGCDASEDGTSRGVPLVAQTITATMYDSGGATAGNNGAPRNLIALVDRAQITSAANRSNPTPGLSHTLHSEPPLAFNLRGRQGGSQPEMADAASLRAGGGGSSNSYVATHGVRRLTPLECERLQGFPDHWTAIHWKKRRIESDMASYLMRHGLECWQEGEQWLTRVAADTPRYRAIGNSMAVPVLRYLLERIRIVDVRLS